MMTSATLTGVFKGDDTSLNDVKDVKSDVSMKKQW